MLVLIVDKQLSVKEEKLINEYNTEYQITQGDLEKYVEELPKVDYYIVDISKFGLWYSRNLPHLKCKKIYYKKSDRLNNIDKFEFDFIIANFPTDATSSEDLEKKLSYNILPIHMTRCVVCCDCLCSNISCFDFFRFCCGLGSNTI